MTVPPYHGPDNVESEWKGREFCLNLDGHSYAPVDASVMNSWGTRFMKKVGIKTASALNQGITITQKATGAPTLVSLAKGSACASALGIPLLIAGGVLTLATSFISMHSALKTFEHENNLKMIRDKAGTFACDAFDSPGNREQHAVIQRYILPYIIQKKDAKGGRKFMGAIPVMGAYEPVRAIGKKIYKYYKHTLGVNRRAAASWLGVHLITHNCGLCQSIVAELFSGFEKMLYLQTLNSKELIPLLMEKMKST